MKRKNSFISNPNFYIIAVIGIIVLRLFLNGFIPLMDKTEARYAEIARIMVETNNWITPQIDYGVPFWAKPPLSTWLSALSMKAFGVNEFAVRFPYLLLCVALVILIGQFAKEKKLPFFLSGFILLSLPEFLLHAGVVSTDTALCFFITLAMLSFWKAIHLEKISGWSYLFFVALGLGLLSKGPIVVILTMPPIVLWVMLFKEYRNALKRFPWILGSIISLAIAVPWYYLAELKTKGFIDYFIVGEHFKRFFDASWKGDKYGFPKKQPLGIIWVFLFAFAMPWIQLVAAKTWKIRKELLKNKWLVFLLFWLIWTPLFFTVSRSLIHTYTLPVMVPVALLALHFWESIKNKKRMVLISLILPFLAIITTVVALTDNNLEKYSNTDKYLIQEQLKNNDLDLFYLGRKSYSSQFYSKGHMKSITPAELTEKLKHNKAFNIIIPHKRLKIVDPSDCSKMQILKSNSKKDAYVFRPNSSQSIPAYKE
ncbi:ArnT family glycosyltransferase [Ancylomarina longa]|uniref:Glycosyltransferase family 39 protein n=1 Tax=Ancylomarina longa TaxID=2487017 RepID=A0A434AX53_9BACT|nr:glycosyltransferase family 39 protein [Ancylomarina longa]RUT79115.1 glycosyltransferase family 39 protein [Ancylomarina longa]